MITIRAGEAVMTLAPEIGGAVVEWRRKGLPMFRPTSAETLAQNSGRLLASYPLVPFSNRIANHGFTWAGKTHSLPTQFGGFTIHGVGFLREWTVLDATDTSVTITLEQPPCAEWPFHLRTWQRFDIEANRLTNTIGVQNLDTVAWPAGIGQHPFFPRSPKATLKLSTGSVWHNHATTRIPTHRTPPPPEWDFSQGAPVGPVFVDNGFAGWDGHAELDYPDLGYRLTIEASEPFRHTVVFIPDGQPFFAVEPVSHMNDAINRIGIEPDQGLVVLAPGEKLEGTILYEVTDR